jgi:hypothetical protein
MTLASLDECWMTLDYSRWYEGIFSLLPAPIPGRIANYAIRPSAASPELAFFASRSSQNYGTKEGTPPNPAVLRLESQYTIHASATRRRFFDAVHQEHGLSR